MRLKHAILAALACATGSALADTVQPGATPAGTRQAIQAAIDEAAAQSPGSPAVGMGMRYEGMSEDLDRSVRSARPAAGCHEYGTRPGTVMIMQ
ncbi:MAG: hypothetical protein IJI73_07420 [Kiritimatiellae bacterium]|nr:hypothetical protein [Kiritimatiellia bacterium]